VSPSVEDDDRTTMAPDDAVAAAWGLEPGKTYAVQLTGHGRSTVLRFDGVAVANWGSPAPTVVLCFTEQRKADVWSPAPPDPDRRWRVQAAALVAVAETL
jgi:hypothetical protein